MTATIEGGVRSLRVNANPNAVEYLKRKYLRRDSSGNVAEDPEGMFSRVARVVAGAEKSDRRAEEVRSDFYEMLASLSFLPSSPMLMSAGTGAGQFSSVYVVPYTSVSQTAREIRAIQASGGGVGFDLSGLDGSLTALTRALGEFDRVVNSVLQCGRRRGCNMAVMRVDNPLARSFMKARVEGGLTNTGTSLLLSDSFMEAACRGESFEVSTKEGMVKTDASSLLDEIALSAWKCGEPGVIFVDEVNRANPTPHLGPIRSVSPCAVAPLLPYESCMLGSLNLLAFAHDGGVDFEGLEAAVRLGTRFLDDAITVNPYPSGATRHAALQTRKIGIGVMGLADLLASQRFPYGTEDARALAEKVMRTISEQAASTSRELAEERGPCPACGNGGNAGAAPQRNATLTAIAPTGSISVIAGCWGGIEPYYGAPSVRRILDDLVLTETNPVYSALATKAGDRATGEELGDLFKSAWEIPYEDQVLMVAGIQRHVDNAVAKTVTLGHEATPEEVRSTIVLAWKTRCKGIALFRVGSVDGWILKAGG